VTSLADQFSPGGVHEAPITAAAYDADSGVVATADADGLVAVQRRGESTPGLLFTPGAEIRGAIGLVRGGSLVAVGDEAGSVGVFRTDTGEPTFQEGREGARGRVRAMRGLALNPSGESLASIAADGLLRIWDLTSGERVESWQGFGGRGLDFDAAGDRLLAIDDQGQPRLVDLRAREGLPMDRVQMNCDWICFTHDCTYVICGGGAGVAVLRVVDGAMVGSTATRGGTGIIGVALSPDAAELAAVTRRQCHIFRLPDLQHLRSQPHGAGQPSGASVWTPGRLQVAGGDGQLHDGRKVEPVGRVAGFAGFGSTRVILHEAGGNNTRSCQFATWSGNSRQDLRAMNVGPGETRVDRDGRYMAHLPQGGQLRVYDIARCAEIFDAGPETVGAESIAVGGPVVAARLRTGGLKWWNLEQNNAFQLDWPRQAALSGSGTWIAVVTPRGQVRVLSAASGEDEMLPPEPLADFPVRLLTFVNRRPELLVVDADGVLGYYDLALGIRRGVAAEGRDLLKFHVPVDRVWGVTGGAYCIVRLPDGDRCSMLAVSLDEGDPINEVTDLHPDAVVDVENGHILEPARAGALIERAPRGHELRVIRSLPGGEWIAFSERGILDASEGAAGSLSS